MDKIDPASRCEGLHPFQVGELSLLSHMDEGVQAWDKQGRLVYANPASENHFPGICDLKGQPYTKIINHCLDEKGQPILSQNFPISIALKDRLKTTKTIIQTDSKGTQWLELTAYLVPTRQSQHYRIISTTHDVTDLIKRSHDLAEHAAFDALTGLPNRTLLSDRLERSKSRTKRQNETLAICLLDLDGFKPVNDTLGHDAGDQLLKEISRRLESQLRPDDTALRLGGDEFVLIFGGLKSDNEIDVIMRRLLQTIAVPMNIDGNTASVTASIGVTLFPYDSSINDQLLRHADQAMYKAKEGGKNNYHLFDPTLESRHKANLSAKQKIAKGLKDGQFELYYQPQVDCAMGKVMGAEALVRWHHPILGVRPPSEFLPLIENDDLIIDFGKWVIRTAIDQILAWDKHGYDLSIGINLSARHLLRGEFTQYIEEISRQLDADILRRIEFELLETAALEDLKFVGDTINHFKSSGIGFALDDFGTGYSSLTHLKHLAVDTLKIDKSFVRDMLFDPGDLAIVQGVLGLSEAFNSHVIAEGVETIDQILKLLSMGCTTMQGFAIARPMKAEYVMKWVDSFEQNPLWNAAKDKYPSRQVFEIQILEATQRYWHARAVKVLEGSLKNKPDMSAYTYENSRIKKWYTDENMLDFAEFSEFHEIDLLNHNLHHLFEGLIQAKIDKAKDLPEKLNAFALENEKLISVLGRLKVLIADL